MKIDKRKIVLLTAERKMTFGELSEPAGISRGNLVTVLNRENNQPRTIGKLAEALGVEPSAIVESN